MNANAAPLPSLLSPGGACPAAPDASGTVRLGVFDSGFGGLSVLRALRQALPGASISYVADSGHAPYGERDERFVLERASLLAEHLFEHHHAQMLVVACNTATAAAVHELRTRWPHLPIVGVEPGLKPAVEASRQGVVGVMATPGTLRSDKFQRLLGTHGAAARVHLQPCPGLAAAIERGQLDDPALISLVEGFCKPLSEAGVDTVVLGCTHYPFVAHHIAAALGPDVKVIDTAQAVARRVQDLALRMTPSWDGGRAGGHAAGTRLFTTGDPSLLADVAWRWLELQADVERCAI